MRVGLYNRWLATLGGGEKHSLAIAEYLSQNHQVQVISHKPVPKDLVEERLNLDLSKVEFKLLPECRASELSPYTADYDLFINASYLDFFPSLAKTSATLIYFPARFSRSIALKRNLKLAARKSLKLPSFIAGVHSFEPRDTSFIWSTEPVVKIQLPRSQSAYRACFEICRQDLTVQQANVILDGQFAHQINFKNGDRWNRCEVLVPGGNENIENHDLTIRVEGGIRPDGKPKLGITNFWLSLPQFRLYHTLFETYIKGVGWRLQYYPPGTSMLDYVDTYGMIWANSEFTRKWIQHYWNRQSEVLYPLVDMENLHPWEKRNYILSVGRFFAGQHNKKHLDLIAAFKGLVDQGLRGWEFHLAGGTTPGDENWAYLEDVLNASRGYPITIHPDLPYDQLSKLYGESSIYWHASGYREDEHRNPDKFEHFGITTVEAMAAGCVPVVIAKGGQPEIVVHGVNGFLWHTLEDLQAYTFKLIEDASLMQDVAEKAIQNSHRYNRAHFQARLDDLLGKIGFQS